MRIAAFIFSFFGFCGLLMLLNVMGYHFMPASAGPEGGLIDAGIGFVFGGIASLIAMVLAFLDFWRARSAKSSRLLLAWCCLVLFGFVFVYFHRL
jgi:hypothetical protein